MGYTHYWDIHSTTAWQATWPQLVSDTRLIVQAAGVRLTNVDGDADEEPEISQQGIHLNGYPDSHEPFTLEPKATGFNFCKTGREEYDVVVTSILLRASQLAGEAISVRCVGMAPWVDFFR
jgi:hypothetical protein